MKTLFKCEICGKTSENRDDVIACEARCRLAKDLDEIFGSDEWNPPMLLRLFKQWSQGDRAEMASRIDAFYTKHYR